MKPNKQTIKKMESLVSEVTGVEEDFRKISRKRELVQSRQLSMTILKEETTLSLAKIGAEYGKDHATVLHAVKTINNLMDTDKKLREKWTDLFIRAHELFKVEKEEKTFQQEARDSIKEELLTRIATLKLSETIYLNRINDLTNEVNSLKRSLEALKRNHQRQSIYTVNYNR